VMISLRPATRADLPRIFEVRYGTAENRLSDPSLVTDEEVGELAPLSTGHLGMTLEA
jgi:hypothetical protein